ncbi:hypothetical protein EAG_02776 [Camponotus floridanus]|uniref:Uncharacterized protein n=1 Tax=Camponotus floridanus TaxID=104421 RepID=E2AHP2_CAMFO|nr:hypothetical protein EAG_02776 [Camponotus floridanus]
MKAKVWLTFRILSRAVLTAIKAKFITIAHCLNIGFCLPASCSSNLLSRLFSETSTLTLEDSADEEINYTLNYLSSEEFLGCIDDLELSSERIVEEELGREVEISEVKERKGMILEEGMLRVGLARPAALPLPERRMRCFRCLEMNNIVVNTRNFYKRQNTEPLWRTLSYTPNCLRHMDTLKNGLIKKSLLEQLKITYAAKNEYKISLTPEVDVLPSGFRLIYQLLLDDDLRRKGVLSSPAAKILKNLISFGRRVMLNPESFLDVGVSDVEARVVSELGSRMLEEEAGASVDTMEELQRIDCQLQDKCVVAEMMPKARRGGHLYQARKLYYNYKYDSVTKEDSELLGTERVDFDIKYEAYFNLRLAIKKTKPPRKNIRIKTIEYFPWPRDSPLIDTVAILDTNALLNINISNIHH